ncbi:hypothetical protein [Canibacter oris]|uniref:Uncharacterized protein n=1 Tax=Canibacter oris TaxID=1365628 RepID=A0A840DKK8_9MICO|nr:hypothetical protein [Canibacter oris]MBB4072002.1 hypothetical protein [Canibacter oris]
MTGTNSETNYGKAHFLPWIVVGVIAIIALVGATVFVNQFKAAQNSPETVTTAAENSEPSNGQTTTTTPNQSSAEQQISAAVPQVSVGETYTLDITQWEKKFEVSNKLRGLRYELVEGDTKAVLSIALVEELPESCAAMREQFGFKRDGDKFEVFKPATVCAAAPELYNEIWGLLEAAVKTAH